MKAGVTYPEFDVARNAITLVELARHCKQKTRGTDQTAGRVDSHNVTSHRPIWFSSSAQRNAGNTGRAEDALGCITRSYGIDLYTITGQINKGGVKLKTLKCTRGSTTLESFHFHQARFIPPGKCSPLPSLLDRWNNKMERC